MYPLANKASEATRQARLKKPEHYKAIDRACYQRRAKYLSAKYSEVQQILRRTRAGKITLTYRQMQARVRGQSSPQYEGLVILPRAEFESWAKSDAIYNSLFDAWEASGFRKELSPSIDRIDQNDGYTLNNIQWLTTSGNSRKARLQDPLDRRSNGTFKPK